MDTQPEEIDGEKLEKSLQTYLIRGSQELRDSLGLDERSHRFMSRAHNARGRNHYLYEVLDEVEQIGVWLMASQESYSGPNTPKASNQIQQRIQRNTLEMLNKDQALRIRRMIETLAALINFQTINTNDYFDHYLLYKELFQAKKRKSDLKDYFECDNHNNDYRIQALKRSISNAEQRINLSNCWYLQGANPRTDGLAGEASFQTVFNCALKSCTKAERLLLGFYYGRGFREPSETIHLNIGSIRNARSYDYLIAGRTFIFLLATACLSRAAKLVRKRGGRKQTLAQVVGLQKLFEQIGGEFTKEFVLPDVRKGDFVSLNREICEVIGIKKSRYGYRSFTVRFLIKPFVAEIDCYPAFYFKKRFDYKEIRDGAMDLLGSSGQRPLKTTPQFIRKAMRASVVRIWMKLIESQ